MVSRVEVIVGGRQPADYGLSKGGTLEKAADTLSRQRVVIGLQGIMSTYVIVCAGQIR